MAFHDEHLRDQYNLNQLRFMKILSIPIIFYCLPFIAVNAHSQEKFYVKGKIDNLKDGEKLSLFRYRDGSIDGASSDTICKGQFSLSDTVSRPTLYWVLGGDDSFPSQALEIWATPGLTTHVSGKGNLLKTWTVTSSSREQQEENQYLAPSIANWNKVQKMEMQRKEIHRKMQHSIGNEKDSLENCQDLLSHQSDSILAIIDQSQIGLLRKLPVTEIWLNKMWRLALKLTYDPRLPSRESILQLYKRMSNRQRATLIGEQITANLFPPTVVKIGDAMADTPLLDTQMITHKLTEYVGKGKYLLLDFGFINCGACIEAIPETKILHDSLVNKLTIVGINVDETAYWKSKLKEKQLSWVNLNDYKGRSGLASRYGVKGYPYYVIISPNGIVLGTWMGYYGKGDLTKRILQYIK